MSIKCFISCCLQLVNPSAFHRPQSQEVIAQTWKDGSHLANGKRKRGHNGPNWPGWEAFIATDGALPKKGNYTKEWMKKMNPFQKWILDFWVSVLYKNHIISKTASPHSLPVFQPKAFYSHKDTQKCLQRCTKLPHYSGKSHYGLVENLNNLHDETPETGVKPW